MDIEKFIERARVLINLNRKQDAVKQLHEALAYEPNNLYVIQLLCSCYYDLGNYKESLERAHEMISLSPDEALGYYFLAINYGVLDKNELALKNIDIAISLDPWDADYFAYKAALYVDDKEWEKVIETTNEALEIDPEHTNSLNHRITALTKLNRKDEILTHVAEVLASDPDNAYSHSTIGWSKLETKEYKEAQKHFAEALRLDPNSNRARIGMTNSIKGTNFLYSLVLRYSFWVNNHKGNIGWGIGIGVFVLSRFLKVLAAVSPIFLLLFVALFALIYFSWILNPISNLILKFDKYGKYLLTPDEHKAVNIVSLGLVASIVSLLLLFTFHDDFFIYLAVFSGTIIIPFSNYYDTEPENQSQNVYYYSIITALVGFISLIMYFIFPEHWGILGVLYLIGVIAFTWIRPILSSL